MRMKQWAVLLLLILLSPVPVAQAETADEEVPLSVKPLLPDNQIGGQSSFFDLAIEPKRTQRLEVLLYNSSPEEIEVQVSTNHAATNSNGVLTYDGGVTMRDEEMPYGFDDLASPSKDIYTVAPFSHESVYVTVNMPGDSFEGIILGGIHFLYEGEEGEETEGISLVNQYAYSVAVRIQDPLSEASVEPELILDDVEPGLIHHRTGLLTTFTNPTPVLIHDLRFQGAVHEAGEEEPLYTRDVTPFSVGPHNRFHFPVMFENERLQPGNYVFYGEAENETDHWTFEMPFSISEELANETNIHAVETAGSAFDWLLLIAVLSIVLLIAVSVLLYMALRRFRRPLEDEQ